MLRQVLKVTTEHGFAVDEMKSRSDDQGRPDLDGIHGGPAVEVMLQVHGKGSVTDLAARLSELPRVRAVTSDSLNAAGE